MRQWDKRNVSEAKKFGVRFLICLAVFSVGYVAIFGVPRINKHRPATISQRYAALRAELNQSYITNSTLTALQENTPVSYNTLTSLISKLRDDTKRLETARQALGGELPAPDSATLQTIGAKQKAAVKALDARNALLSTVMAYDPATDLTSLDLRKETTKAATRATAAQNGLTKVILGSTTATSNDGLAVGGADGAPSLLTPSLQSLIESEANCFGQLASHLSAGQTDQAVASRASCVTAYPELRHQAIRSTIEGALGQDYQQYMKQTIPPLLKRLNSLQNQS
ncbi:MAG: hypothetical protein JWO35_505 [Candidatus Saccharibacteria bacterium]|nr:hypothetical protein [Candidatus Saccharibacteria bacterium]